MLYLEPASGEKLPLSVVEEYDEDVAFVADSDSYRQCRDKAVCSLARSDLNADIVFTFALPSRVLVAIDGHIPPLAMWEHQPLELPAATRVALRASRERFDELGVGGSYLASLSYQYDEDQALMLIRRTDGQACAWYRCMTSVVWGVDERSELVQVWLQGVLLK